MNTPDTDTQLDRSNEQNESGAPAHSDGAPESPRPVVKRRYHALLALGGLAAVLLAIGVMPRLEAKRALTDQVAAQRALPVSIVTPKPAPASSELLLPGSVMPYADASIYARTSGYVTHWYTDIGAKVKAGETLAVIETPELDAQLRQARADEATAQANYAYANTTAQRWHELLKTQSVAPQDADAKTSDMEAKRSILASAQANVARLSELVSYEKVTAPFDGVVTARNVDIGSLVTAGGAPGLATMPGELFHVEQTSTLRVYIDVPQNDASEVKPGTSVYLTTQQYPGRRFDAKVARSADAIDPVSRTLRVEVDVDNAGGALLPGAYAQVHLQLDSANPALELPVSALLFRPDGVTVALAGADNTVQLKTVTIGRDFGTYVEIATGLTTTDRVINNPGDSIVTGEPITVEAPAPGAAVASK
ncbi:efflux RND transporter periplasmic adaptor subunit [Paraburkholderia rhizosphaerae]|uniref:RND family efflux transporter MFP subunit n=1 Tax=Paraburkholderia rhizosphaerae TaxID=480658 RepID=A0A4V3HF55_9BURK|nr:efflux RND transporter periplasmic adaptor subunit [Paraburkholderia rhizosphaerae]TDY51531.1 RND family efflux transporter MFP subunit [Paraburkholderia rhizosphaerae]